MNRPNLFHFATSELSQDAVLAWLLAWADSRYKNLDTDLHGLGVRFLSALLALHEKKSVTDGPMTIRVKMQACRVDVIAEINSEIILAIEDKTGTCSHQGNYEAIELLKNEHMNREILAIYLKTGDQASYAEALSHGFKPFLRDRLIALLREDEALIVRNNIVGDFCAVLEERETSVQAWRVEPVTKWVKNSPPWVGLFQALQKEFTDLHWAYVPNAHGGFMGAWWNWKPLKQVAGAQLYLQISQGPLQFRASGLKKADNCIPLCQGVALRLLEMGSGHNLAIQKTHLHRGETMGIAEIGQSGWIAVKSDGLMDLARTLDNLRMAATLLEAVLTNGESLPTG